MPEVAKLSRTIIDAAKKMMEIEAQMTTESVAIAGERYVEDHTVLPDQESIPEIILHEVIPHGRWVGGKDGEDRLLDIKRNHIHQFSDVPHIITRVVDDFHDGAEKTENRVW
jgi:hypothetical protein